MAAMEPQPGIGGKVCVDTSTEIKGVINAPFSDTVTNEDITAFQAGAVQRFPTIDDASASFDFVFDGQSGFDAGQKKVILAKATHQIYTYVRYLTATVYYTFNAYVENIVYSPGPKDLIKATVTLAVTDGAVLSGIS